MQFKIPIPQAPKVEFSPQAEKIPTKFPSHWRAFLYERKDENLLLPQLL